VKQLTSVEWGGGPGRPQKYPWQEWENGRPWEIVKGEDFNVSTHNMQVNLHMRAAKLDKIVRTRTINDGAAEKLVFQFFSKST
jgi:hypothetical protein